MWTRTWGKWEGEVEHKYDQDTLSACRKFSKLKMFSLLEMGWWGLERQLSGEEHDCSSRVPEYNSQQSHVGLQPPVIRDPIPSFAVSEESVSVLTFIK